MRKLLSVVLAVTGAVTMLGAGTAWANPVEGSYESEFTGVVLEGRWSESFLNGLPGQIGNTVHGASWDGAVLATQWELGDMAIDAAPTQLLNTVDGLGNGTIVWYTTYSGGGLILDKDGPWAPGGGEVADYSITLTHYAHTTQVVYVGGVAVAMATIIEAAGTFDLYPDYDLEMLVAQAIPAGSGGPVPAGYPEWQWPDGYLGEKDVGQWGVVQKIRMTVDWTPIPEPATCGLLGAGIGLLAVARRRRKA